MEARSGRGGQLALCSLCGLLLGHAVQGAEAPDEVDGVDADDFAGGEAGGDDVEGVAVVGSR